ncbi:hypothetical protein DNH61_01355 [Paenibacillus sambharensis]|uniref:DUF4363 domain-containing protein n=1 Tax=Paenibacillus sambharensis TaxID=1803190 RepID=A0A2W1LHK7_9BACL|nr:DUF4363 family protein [Paenibacillus sambharensis]PZD97550.1 hypothetical protein DNH61_01355 [Paenibacillus sambharensis]
MNKILLARWPAALLVIVLVSGLAWSYSALKQSDRNPLTEQTLAVLKYVQAGEWTRAKTEVQELRELFHTKRWILDLLGPNQSASNTRIDIDVLAALIQEENASEAKQLIAQIRARLDDFVII